MSDANDVEFVCARPGCGSPINHVPGIYCSERCRVAHPLEEGISLLRAELAAAKAETGRMEAWGYEQQHRAAAAQAKADALDALEKWLLNCTRATLLRLRADQSECVLGEYAGRDLCSATAPTLAAAITSALSQARGAAGAGEEKA